MTSLAQLQRFVLEAEHLEDFDGAADRRQRVAQLVGEHRQEFVLAAVVFLDVAVEPGVVDGDGRAAGKVFGEREVVGRRTRPRVDVAQAIVPQSPPAGPERDDDRAIRLEVRTWLVAALRITGDDADTIAGLAGAGDGRPRKLALARFSARAGSDRDRAESERSPRHDAGACAYRSVVDPGQFGLPFD